MKDIESISVVVPAYNEEKDLFSSIKTISQYLEKKVTNEYEILIIENGSSDNTAQIAEGLAEESDYIKSYSLDFPSFGAAYRFGILKAKNDIVTLYPVDLAFSLDFIARAFNYIKKSQFPIILGVRFHSESDIERPLIRVLISRVHTLLVNLFFQTKFNDVDCLKAFRTSIAQKLINVTKSNGPFIEVELVYLINKLNIPYVEIPINHVEKQIARHPFYIIKSVIKNFIELIKFRSSSM